MFKLLWIHFSKSDIAIICLLPSILWVNIYAFLHKSLDSISEDFLSAELKNEKCAFASAPLDVFPVSCITIITMYFICVPWIMNECLYLI